VLKLPPTPSQTAGQEAAHPQRNLPPAYEGERVLGTSTPVSDSKTRFMPPLPPRRADEVPAAEPTMSDAERTEWEQHEEEQRLAQAPDAQLRDDEELARRLAAQDLRQ
jgi:hypothetical protein